MESTRLWSEPGRSARRSARRRAAEMAELERQVAAERARAEVAEAALPDLLALGRRTGDAIVADARSRARAILDEARRRAIAELEDQRREVRRETKALDALRLAVAAEAMGLEQIRAELQRRVASSADELARVAGHPGLLGGDPLRLPDVAVAELVAAPRPEDRDGVEGAPPAVGPGAAPVRSPGSAPGARGEAEAVPAAAWTSAPDGLRAAGPSPRFDAAWAGGDEAGDDAFDRFLAGDAGGDRSRAWILAGLDDTGGDGHG